MRNSWRRTLLSLSLGLLCTQSFALTIDQAWTAAKQTSSDYRIKQIEEVKSKNNVSLSKKAFLPKLGAISTGINWNKDNGMGVNGYGISLSQSIWDSRNWMELDQSQIGVVRAQLSIIQAKNALAKELIQAYFSLAQAQHSLVIAKQQHKDSQQLLSFAELRYQAGLIMSTAIDDAKAHLLGTETIILQRQSALVEQQAKLANIINMAPGRVNEINSENLHQPTLKIHDEQAWLLKAKNNSPELLMAKQAVKSQEIAVDSAHANYYPTVSGSVSYSNNFEHPKDSLNAGVSVSIPIDITGTIKTQVSQAKLDLQIAKEQLRSVERNLESNVKTRFKQLALDWKLVEMGEQKLKSDEKALKTKQIMFNSGASNTTALDLISVQNTVFNSKEQLQSLLYQYWLNRIELLNLTGQLTDDTITQISQALAP
ncbi:TolC family protein [Photobacterium lucens]|uniref:TolC family protein n=1 Tax=Photobacterium lucens TaxID=2562949 RepID=UPI00136E4C61|nr:TolC family protein [Photobacterium lucens]MBP2699596.1 TolC family protein [Vibrio parahaemolyticus]MZG56899.1 TolC family protein [Photobacterium lucens]MZG81660.1 TolC family protein [Photobacterium lucens]